eukprot:6012500-Amphidinium_carterae.1
MQTRATREAEIDDLLPGSKRGRVAAILSATDCKDMALQMCDFLEQEVYESSNVLHVQPIVCGVDEARDYLQGAETHGPEYFNHTRVEEIEKLQSLSQGVLMRNGLAGISRYVPNEQMIERRLPTRTYSIDEFESTQSPTPSSLANRILVCAFTHARETGQEIYMRAPREWEQLDNVTADSPVETCGKLVWLALSACAYYHDAWKVLATHHLDDARLGGPEEGIQYTVVDHLKAYFLIKLTIRSHEASDGSSHNYLGRDWVKTRSGWLIVLAQKHLEKVMAICGYESGESHCLPVVTPGVEEVFTEWD